MLDEYDDRQQQGHYKHTLDSATAGRFQTLLWGAGSTGNSGDGSRDIYGVVDLRLNAHRFCRSIETPRDPNFPRALGALRRHFSKSSPRPSSSHTAAS